MRLFIAEKPSLAKAIAETIGFAKYGDGHIVCKNGDIVTWCFGHLLEIVNNKNDKDWASVQLPILPDKWIKSPKKDTTKQISIIKKLCSSADTVINAGDADREGQLIVDEVLEYVHYKGNVLRIWLQALDKDSIQKALRELKHNSHFKTLCESAEARSHADWLVGINLTRIYSINSHRFVSIGRVQTPTLKLIADRDNEIANFKPKDFYVLSNKIAGFNSFLVTKELDKGIDEENRLIDKAYALSIAKATSNTKGKVLSVKTEKKVVNPPMPFSLSTLQKFMSEHHSFSAKATLDTLQSLYEKKLVSYPRTDCEYLPEEEFSNASAILKNIEQVLKLNTKPNAGIKHKAWNSKKLSAHHAIMPTKDFSHFDTLNEKEYTLYKVILKSFFCLFFEPYEYNQIIIIYKINDYHFQSIVKNPLKVGFMVCTNSQLPDTVNVKLKTGDIVSTSETKIDTQSTTPPPHFTDGTLIEAMSHIYRYITDEKAKSILKETDGIGTEATRAAIIETLIKRGFIKRQGKSLISIQPLVNDFLKSIPEDVQSPVLTAQWESKLSSISDGTYNMGSFESEQRQFVDKIIHIVGNQKIVIESPEQPSSNNTKQTKYSTTKQIKTYSQNIPQDAKLCPVCNKPLLSLQTKNAKPYFRCSACHSAFWDNDGNVGKQWSS